VEIAELERQVFRKMMSNPDSLAVNISKISADDFQGRTFKIVIGALSDTGLLANFCPNKNFFEILLRDRVKDTAELDRVATILEKMSSTPEDASDLDLLIKEVKANRWCREMTRIIQDHVDNITPADVEKTYESLVSDLLKLPMSSASDISVATIKEVHECLEDRIALYTSQSTVRYPTGLRAFDEAIGGFAPGEFVVITAGTGAGKSNLMLWWAEQYVKNGANVVYVTIEMSYEETMTRYHAIATGYDVGDIGNKRIPEGKIPDYYKKLLVHAKDPSCKEEVKRALDAVVEQGNTENLLNVARGYPNRKNKMFVLDIGAASPSRIEREVQRLSMDHKIDYVFVDFINVMDPDFHNRDKVKELASISRDLKKVGRRTKTIMFSAAQLDTTSIEGKQNETISPDRVKYARAIAENSDWMIAFHRTEEDIRLKQIRLQLAKHRHSADCAALIEFDFGTMQAIDLGKPEPTKASDMGSADNSKYKGGGEKQRMLSGYAGWQTDREREHD
jgi:replicative DNA helicase